MSARTFTLSLALAAGLVGHAFLYGGDEVAPPAPPSDAPAGPGTPGYGVEVQARGPIHEAFASLTVDPAPTKPITKRPPKPLDEQAPEEKPEGNVSWIGGYWAWDDERSDFLWVSGTWRVPPPGKEWIAGYWREDADNWQWVPGFWAAATKADAPQQVTYLPTPPTTPPQAPAGQPPVVESFWVSGHWAWNGTRYVWVAGYWARAEPGYVWIPAHYSWTPGGYVYVAGYWDLAVKRRGLLYAPVVFRPGIVTVSYSYTPAYAVPDELVVDTLFVRPAYSHYYFGDYYGPAYVGLGYESAYVYSNTHYDSIIVYERYEHRSDPAWFSIQINLYNDRFAGRAPLPPRVIVRDGVFVRGPVGYPGPRVGLAREVAAAHGMRVARLDAAARHDIRAREAVAAREVAAQRARNEDARAAGAMNQARTAPFSNPRASTTTQSSTTTTTSTTTAGKAGAATTTSTTSTTSKTTTTTTGKKAPPPPAHKTPPKDSKDGKEAPAEHR